MRVNESARTLNNVSNDTTLVQIGSVVQPVHSNACPNAHAFDSAVRAYACSDKILHKQTNAPLPITFSTIPLLFESEQWFSLYT